MCQIRRTALGLSFGLLMLAAGSSHATEGGASLYIPGLHGPTAGFVPPPGWYVENDLYIYSGEFLRGRPTQLGGAVIGGVRASAIVDFVTPTWVTPLEILGGNLAFAVTVPFGTPDITAGGLIAAPRLGRSFSFRDNDAVFNVGDPVVTSILGWHAGNFHWSLSASVSIPSGAYRDGELSNLSFNRPIGDITAALTYLDPALGLDVSGAIGYEINGTNGSTDYRSGDAVHFDLAISKYLSKEVSIGFLAGHYEQVSADSGSPLLGAFKGRTTAVGGTLGITGEIAGIPISTRLKVLREVEVQNRPEGTIALLTVSLPLGGQAPPATAAKPISARY